MLKFLWAILFSVGIASAQDGYPKPKSSDKLLFYIQHSSNHNTFVYELNADKSNPIAVFRINFEDKGQKEQLSSIQKKFAYGVNYKNEAKTQFALSALKTTMLELKHGNGSSWVELTWKNQKIKLEHIFIQLQSNSNGINSKPEFVIVYGKNSHNKTVVEKIIL